MSVIEQNHAQTLDLSVSGMSCQGCVGNVRKQLEHLDEHVEVTGYPKEDRLVVITHLPLAQIEQAIHSAGYEYKGLNRAVNAEQIPTRTYRVTGMSCQGCVRNVRREVEALDEFAEVIGWPSDNQLIVTSTLSQDDIKKAVTEAGYQFQGESEPTKETAENVDNSKSVSDEFTEQSVEPDKKVKQLNDSPLQSESVQLSLSGITCAGCVNTIQQALDAVSGVDNAEVNFASRTAQISGSAALENLINAVTNAGYGAEVIEDPAEAQEKRAQKEQQEYQQKVRFSIAGLMVGVPLMLWGLLGGSMHVATMTDQLIWGAVGVISAMVMFYSGRHYYQSAWRAFKHRHSNMDTLIAMGTGAAWLYSMAVVFAPDWLPNNARHLYFEASTMILGLINLGQALEVRARGKTSAALKRLLDLRPQSATVIRNGHEQTIDIANIQIDDLIRVKSGEKLPVDGIVTEGASSINESMLTGEPVPIEKGEGDEVSAGTINGNGSLIYRATKVGGDTLLAQIITMVGKAQNSKPPISRLADQVSSVFVPSVMIISIVAALAWLNFGPSPVAVNMLVAAVSVLIIACPCALGLATPISTMIGVGKAAEYGGLIRNGDALQKASEITTIILDKTGTITEGKPVVTSVDNQHESETLIKSVVEGLEMGANHPLAQALLAYAQDHGEPKQTVEDFESVTGQGVKGVIGGVSYLLGNEALMQDHKIDLPQDAKHSVGSIVYLANSEHLVATFVIEDKIKPSAKTAIDYLRREGITVIMLTGDNDATAKAVAEAVGIDHYQANMRPQDKLDYVKALQNKSEVVGMMGDGINDAPALAQADVGFAMGNGTDVAMESADITLIGHDLANIAKVISISRATLNNIKQNLWGAFGYNSLGIPLAAGVLFPVTGWLLSPVVAGAAMSLSSITVVLNANRLRLFKPKQSSNSNAGRDQ